MEYWVAKELQGQVQWETKSFQVNRGVEQELRKAKAGKKRYHIRNTRSETGRRNSVRAEVKKQKVSSLFWMCGSKYETVQHILCGWTKLAQVEYKKRHDAVGRIIEISRIYRYVEINKIRFGL